jgi:phosphotransferase system enzyme I (PtsI)
MEKINGVAASKGIAIGKLKLCLNIEDQIAKRQIDDVSAELSRLDKAKDEAVYELNKVYLNALKRVGEAKSMIFQIHIMMLQDDDYFSTIQHIIKEQKVNAEYAVWQTGKQFSNMFANMDDEYMQGRASDVLDISKRLIHRLDSSLANGLDSIDTPSIIGVTDLMPSETVQMDKEMALAFVTKEGSKSSHSAILARTMDIPAVVGLSDKFSKLTNNANIIVDGALGEIIIEPDEKTLAEYQQKQKDYEKYQAELRFLKGTEAITKNGVKLEINANIGNPEDVEMVLENDADGIGLFRSEFLYMNGNSLPSEEEQFVAYKSVLEKMGSKRVIIRTLDLGADKQVPYLNLPHEENPALGYRAIRICLDRKELFVTQLRALYRASTFGKLAIMFPMIISVDEVKQIKSIIEQVKSDLSKEGIAFSSDVEIGIMIETPASVMMSAELAKEVDFFSVGTNDLTQYTLAVDRMNHSISNMFDSRNPAVLRMLEIAAKNAKNAGIWIGICGESAADTSLTDFYVKIGVSELSVTPASVLELKKAVQQVDIK